MPDRCRPNTRSGKSLVVSVLALVIAIMSTATGVNQPTAVDAYQPSTKATVKANRTMTAGSETAAGGMHTATMYLEATIATGSHVGTYQNWSARSAFATTTALYVVLSTGTDLAIWRSTDGLMWTEQDAANAPAIAGNYAYSAWLAPDGRLYVAYFSATNTVAVRVFDTSANTWAAADVGADTFDTSASTWAAADVGAGTEMTDVANAYPLRITAAADGNVWLLYRRNSDSDTWRAYWNGTAWAEASVLTTNTSWPVDLALDPATGISYATIYEETALDASYATLNGASVSAVGDWDANAAGADEYFRGSDVALFNDGTNDKVALMVRRSDGGVALHSAIRGEPPTSLTVNQAFNQLPYHTHVAATAFGGRLWLVWSFNTAIRYAIATSLTTLNVGADANLVRQTAWDAMPQFVIGLNGLGVLYRDQGVPATIRVIWFVLPTPPVGTASAAGGTNTRPAGVTATATTGAATVAGGPPEEWTWEEAGLVKAELHRRALTVDAQVRRRAAVRPRPVPFDRRPCGSWRWSGNGSEWSGHATLPNDADRRETVRRDTESDNPPSAATVAAASSPFNLRAGGG